MSVFGINTVPGHLLPTLYTVLIIDVRLYSICMCKNIYLKCLLCNSSIYYKAASYNNMYRNLYRLYGTSPAFWIATSHYKVNACFEFAPRYISAMHMFRVAPCLRDQLNAKDADVTSLPPKCL